MIYIFTFVHVVVSFVLILVVLLQTGKRADLAGAFGGGGSQTAFGARGAATFLSKATTVAAVLFMLTSLGLSLLSSRSEVATGTVLDDSPPASSAPVQPLPLGEQPAEEGLPAVPEPAGEQPAEQPSPPAQPEP